MKKYGFIIILLIVLSMFIWFLLNLFVFRKGALASCEALYISEVNISNNSIELKVDSSNSSMLIVDYKHYIKDDTMNIKVYWFPATGLKILQGKEKSIDKLHIEANKEHYNKIVILGNDNVEKVIYDENDL